MSIYPTSTAAHVAVVGLALLAAGVALREPGVAAWGGAVVVAVALARLLTLLGVARIRAAGFEMLWNEPRRVVRVACGATRVLAAELRNRDTRAVRFDNLRVVASPALQARVEPTAGEVRASGAVLVQVHLRARRVGFHGVHGLSLEVRTGPGLFEIPLTFANPFGLEVLPRALVPALASPRGGRSRRLGMAGRAGRARGDGTDLRELREHHSGDPLRRIAWKASARRGVLVVREFEREERDVVVLVLDASVELWAGPVGQAPLDHAIDVTASLAMRHLGSGDLVGLWLVGGRELGRVAPDNDRAQLARIAALLAGRTGVLDADRCGWDEADLAAQVLEHARPLDPTLVADGASMSIDRLAKRVAALRRQAPFARPAPYGRSGRDRRLRHYAACFGLHAPARLEPDRPRSTLSLAEVLGRLAKRAGPRPSVVHVVAPVPADEGLAELGVAVRRLKTSGAVVRWSSPPLEAALAGSGAPAPASVSTGRPDLGETVAWAVRTRLRAAERRGEASLRALGVRIVPPGSRLGADEGAGDKRAPEAAP